MLNTSFRYCNQIKYLSPGFYSVGSTHYIRNVDNQRKQYSKSSKEKPPCSDCCKDVVQTKGKEVRVWPRPDPPPPAWRGECPTDPQPPHYDPYKIKVPDIVVPPLPPSNARPMLECAKTKGPCSVKPAPPPPPCPLPPKPPFPWIYVWSLAAFLGTMGLIYKYYLYLEEKWRLGENKPIWRPRLRVKRPYHAEDLPPCVQYLIIGTGAAGWAAYRAIMDHDKTAKVFMISKEDILPYRRPQMSKLMWWNPEPPDIMNLHYTDGGRRYTMFQKPCNYFMDPVKFYRKKTGPAVSLATGWCVTRVDADDHVVWIKSLCEDRPMYYERLLIAPGAKAKNLDIFKSAPKPVRDKVCTFQTIRDLEIAYRKVEQAKSVVVLGGGCLGCELAWHLARRHKEIEKANPELNVDPVRVTHIYKGNGIMSNVVPEYLGEWAAEKIKCEGVKMLPKTQVYDAYETPDGRLELTLSNGTSIVTDYVFVAVGATPRDELAEPSFLELDPINGGFKVSSEMKARTHLYIAGDAASVYTQWKDTRQRMEHYDDAEEQGYIAGMNMTGYWTPYNGEQHYWLKLGEALQMEVVGEVGACMPTVALFKPCKADDLRPEEVVYEKDGSQLCYKDSQEYQSRYKRGMLFYLRDEFVVGMVFWNFPAVPDRKDVVREMIRARPTYKDINMLADLLGFPESKCAANTLVEEVKEEGPCIKNWREF